MYLAIDERAFSDVSHLEMYCIYVLLARLA
jgi:hypothetical protein